jgi:hypothetical protein
MVNYKMSSKIAFLKELINIEAKIILIWVRIIIVFSMKTY